MSVPFSQREVPHWPLRNRPCCKAFAASGRTGRQFPFLLLAVMEELSLYGCQVNRREPPLHSCYELIIVTAHIHGHDGLNATAVSLRLEVRCANFQCSSHPAGLATFSKCSCHSVKDSPVAHQAGCWSPPDAGTEVSVGCVELGASPAVTSLCRCVRGGPDVLNFSAIKSRLLASSNLQ